ncbi:MAG TPA: hypothetical protein VFI17_08245 [Solirubrobacterales bacterium]|nr:hypothetical protein [Solirubrobacterales bacterium]
MNALERTEKQMADLSELSLRALPGMFDEQTALFSHKTVVVDGAYRNREPNVLYSSVSLVGLLRQRRRPVDEVMPLGPALDGLYRAVAERGVPGEMANFVWAATIAGDERAAEILRRLCDVDPRVCSGGELGQVLYGLVRGAETFPAERDRAAAAAAAAAAELLARFVPAADTFKSTPRHRRLPRRELLEARLGSFAAQVYPLHGLAAYYLWNGETPAPALARVAARIVEAQGPMGEWYWIYSTRKRAVLEGYPVYSVHQDGMAFLGLMELERLGLGSFVEPLALGLDWVFGANDLGVSLVRREPPMIHRCIMRAGSDADGPYGVPAANLRQIFLRSLTARPGRDYTDADPAQLEVLEECRSYHLGWALYADSLVQEAQARHAGGRA